MAAQPKSENLVLSAFFNARDSETRVTAREFAGELKALDADEKSEMAVLAAAEMGLTQDEVKFNLG